MPKRLSLDEFSRRKGKGNFATIVTDLDKSSLLEIIDSHKSDDIIRVLGVAGLRYDRDRSRVTKKHQSRIKVNGMPWM